MKRFKTARHEQVETENETAKSKVRRGRAPVMIYWDSGEGVLTPSETFQGQSFADVRQAQTALQKSDAPTGVYAIIRPHLVSIQETTVAVRRVKVL